MRNRSKADQAAVASSRSECFDSGNTVRPAASSNDVRELGGEEGSQSASADEPSAYQRRASAAQSAASTSGRILLDDFEAAACFGVSRRTFRELCDRPWMPRAVVLGPRIVRWPRAELEAAIANMPRQENASEPAQLRRARIESMKSGSGEKRSRRGCASD